MKTENKLRSGWRVTNVLRFLFSLIPIIYLAATGDPNAFAQGTRGTISGRVTDPNGAVINQATVKLFDIAKQQAVRTVQTNAEGVYQFVEVEPAVYELTFTATGFAEARLKDVKVEPNRNVQLDATLTVGGATEGITVTAGQELVDRESPTLGTTVDSRRVIGLPLDGRNVLNLALLQPGVTPSNLNTTATFGQGLGIRVNGSRGVENNLTLDGSNNNEVAVGGASGAQPRPDAVQEFRLLTSNFEAEFGRNTGSVINVVTRSGASDFHGNLRFFYRPTFLSSARFFDKALPGSRPSTDDFRRRFERKEFGGNIGGPIWLPKKVFGPLGTETRNRAFFFFDYEERRQLIGDTRAITGLPTAEERGGIFTARLGATGLPIPLLDPATGQPFPVISGSLTTPNSTVKQQIPSARYANNPIVQYYLGFLPVGDVSGTASAGANEITNNKYYTGRGDFLLTDKQTVNFTYNQFDQVIDSPFAFDGSRVPGFGSDDKRTTYNLVARHTYAITPTLVNSLLLGYARNNQPSVAPQNLTTPREIGFSRDDFVADQRFIGPPSIRLFDRSDFRIGNTVQGPQARIWENFQIQDSLSWARGDHRFKLGFDGTQYYGQSAFVFINNGGFLFSRNFGGNTSGNDFADFLLDNPVFYQFGNTADRDFRQKAIAAFAQDSWRVKDNFTLSLGLRYEFLSPLSDKYNRVVYYRTGATSQLLTSGQLRDVDGRLITVTPGRRAPFGPVFAGDPDPVLGGNVPDGGVINDLNNFGPRIGIAWSPKASGGWLQKLLGAEQTVIRAGFGIYYGAIIGDAVLQQNGAPGFGSIVTQVFGNGAGTTADPFAPDPYPTFNGNGPALQNPITAPRTIGAPMAAFPGFVPDPELRTPYVYQYNLTFERSFFNNYVVSLSYVGNRGRELYITREVNPGLGTFFPFPAGRTPPAGGVTNGNVNLRRTNDDIQTSIPILISDARSWFNAFEAQVQKRYSNGLLFQVAYTFSKSINEGDTQRSVLDVVDRRFSRGLSADDVPHRLVASWLYDLPFGRNFQGLAKRLFDGYSLGGIATFQSGTPFSVANISGTVGSEGIVSFADLGSAFAQVDARENDRRAFNANSFSPVILPADLTGVFRRGTAGRNMFRAANGINNFDLIVSKKTRLWNESSNLELRFEAFNAFNHTQFTTLDLNLNNIVRDSSGAIDPNRSSFGKFTGARESRVVQLAARFSF
ncbi:MAG: TonB-dependent receptor [Acidobacteria bacterium]|nr:TonB-dependent receptor [Acidobacteriota bacterium]